MPCLNYICYNVIFFVFFLVLVSIEKTYQALKTMFNQIAQHLFFFSTLSVFGNGVKQSFVLDILLFNQNVASTIKDSHYD